MKTAKTLFCLFLAVLLLLPTAILTAQPALAEEQFNKEEAIEAVRSTVYYNWLFTGFYEEFCRADEEWAQERGNYPQPDACDLYRDWLIEKGYAERKRATVENAAGTSIDTPTMHAFPAGVTLEKIREDQAKYAPPLARYYGCSNRHATDEVCSNIYFATKDGILYGRVVPFDKDLVNFDFGPFTTAIDPLTLETSGSVAYVSGNNRYAFYIENTDDGVRFKEFGPGMNHLNAGFAAVEHLPYETQYADLLDAAAKGAYLLSHAYFGFSDKNMTTDTDAYTLAEVKLYEFFKDFGLVTDRDRVYRPDSTNEDVIGSYLHTYAFSGIATEKEFRAATEKYLSKGYVDQILEMRLVFEENGALWSHGADVGTLFDFRYDMLRVKEYADNKAIIVITDGYDEDTMILQKNGDNWIVVGGVFPGEFFLQTPATGDDTAIFIILSLVAVSMFVVMVFLGTRRKNEV